MEGNGKSDGLDISYKRDRRLSYETRRVLNPTINFVASRIFPVDRQLITADKLNTPVCHLFFTLSRPIGTHNFRKLVCQLNF